MVLGLKVSFIRLIIVETITRKHKKVLFILIIKLIERTNKLVII